MRNEEGVNGGEGVRRSVVGDDAAAVPVDEREEGDGREG